MKSRLLKVLLLGICVFSISSVTLASYDVFDIKNTKYEDAVETLIEHEIISCYPDGTYRPENIVTRAEMARLVVSFTGLDNTYSTESGGGTQFNDVSSEHWASGYINLAYNQKFINGYEDGSFKPGNTVTYAEAITMIIRSLGYKEVVEAKGIWPQNYIDKAVSLGIMKEINVANYNEGALRGNIAIMLYNALDIPQYVPKQNIEYSETLKLELNSFLKEVKDIERDISYYYDLADLTRFEDVAFGYLGIGQNNAREMVTLIEKFINSFKSDPNAKTICDKLEVAKSHYEFVGNMKQDDYGSLSAFKMDYLQNVSSGLQIIIEVSKEIEY